MSVLSLIFAPHPIFKQKATPVVAVNDTVRKHVADMLDTLYFEGAIGLGANMVGIKERIAVVDLQEGGVRNPYIFINPEITWRAEEQQTFKEASLCFPGIDAEISRPKAIKLSYLDLEGAKKTLEAEGILATVIQHEVDYLDGKVFLDYLTRLKREMLIKKMQKYIKQHPPHIHGEHCHH